MRFALMELKMALVRLLTTYSLVNCTGKTNKCFEQLETGFLFTPKEVIIRLQHRDEYHE
jgi:cytochrome P450